MLPFTHPHPDGLILRLKVTPNASRSQVVGLLGDALKVKVAAPPEDGKANQAVCRLIAQVLGVADRLVEVIAGHSQSRKQVLVRGISLAAAEGALAPFCGP